MTGLTDGSGAFCRSWSPADGAVDHLADEVDEEPADPELEAGEVDLDHGPVAQLQVEASIGNLKGRLLYKIMMDNPLTYLVDVPRSILFGQGTEYWPQFIGVTILSFAVLLLGAKIFEIVQDLIAERL